MRFGTLAFFSVTAVALALAVLQIIKTLFDGSNANSATAFGELLLVIVLGVGEILAFFELRYVRNDRQFQSWNRAQDIWKGSDFREARRRIFQRLHGGATEWSQKEREDALEVCRRMDEFAYLIPFLGLRNALAAWDDPLAKGWMVLKPIVQQEREATGWKEKWKAFETVGKKALEQLGRENRDPRISGSTVLD